MAARLGTVLCVALCVVQGAAAGTAKVPDSAAAIAIAKGLCTTPKEIDRFPNPTGPWVAKLQSGSWTVRHYSVGETRECDWEGVTVRADTGAIEPTGEPGQPGPLCLVCISAH